MTQDDSKAREPQLRVVDRRWWARGQPTEGDETVGLRKPSYIEELEQRLADTIAQTQTVAAERRRLQEEFEQVRTRMKREADREVERARRALLVDLLEVLDNLDRAAGAGRSSSNAQNAGAQARMEQLLKGVEMVRDQFLAKLTTLGVTRVVALGEPFDASRHEAVSTTPVAEDERDGLVLDVIKDGYVIGDELLRPASVVVAKKS